METRDGQPNDSDPSNVFKSDPGGIYLTTNPTNLFSINTLFNEGVWTGTGAFVGYRLGAIPEIGSLAYPGAVIGALAYTALLLRNKWGSILSDYEKWFAGTFGNIDKYDPNLKSKFERDFGLSFDAAVQEYDDKFYKYDKEALHFQDWLYVFHQRGTDRDTKSSFDGAQVLQRWNEWENSVIGGPLRLRYQGPPAKLPPPLDIRTAQERQKDNGATSSDLVRLNRIVMTLWEKRNPSKTNLSTSSRMSTSDYEWVNTEINKEYRGYTLGNKDKFLSGWETNLGIK